MLLKIRHLLNLLINHFLEWRLGIRSEEEIQLKVFGIHDPDCHTYNATTPPVPANDEADRDPGQNGTCSWILAPAWAACCAGRHLSLPESDRGGVHQGTERNRAGKRPPGVAPVKCKDIELNNTDARQFVYRQR